MKFVAVLCLTAIALASAAPLQESEYQTLFTAFVQEHGKTYEDLNTMFQRYNIFKTNMNTIIQHQENERRTFDMAMNQFGDMTNEEFTSQYNNYKPETTAHYGRRYANLSTANLPSSVDWPSKGVVTPVKNQGQCGSCWSFSTTGAVESATAIKTGQLNSLSEQQLVDCSGSYGNQGCNGGQMQAAFQYVHATGGLESESEYPYTAADGTCQKPFSTLYDPITGYQNVQQNSEMALKAAVAQQPVSVAVDASGSAWQFYSGGVVSSACGTQLDHGVLAAGYGTDGSTEYWLVKNSWGASWGESGYIRLERTDSSSAPGECGIAMDASYPTV